MKIREKTYNNVIEIGGPSELFSYGELKIYDLFNNVDGINMQNNIWQKDLTNTYNYYNNKTGKQYITDLCDISSLKIDNKYDMIISCHVIEHLANPIKIIEDLKKILNDEAYIFSIIPNKYDFWDNVRETTTLEHLISDYNNNTDEGDLTHLEENLQTTHFKNNKSNTEDAINNYETRIIHHHCFDMKLVQDFFEYVGFKTIECYISNGLHIAYFGKINKINE
jgi:SAM-dependent methyltransferase